MFACELARRPVASSAAATARPFTENAHRFSDEYPRLPLHGSAAFATGMTSCAINCLPSFPQTLKHLGCATGPAHGSGFGTTAHGSSCAIGPRGKCAHAPRTTGSPSAPFTSSLVVAPTEDAHATAASLHAAGRQPKRLKIENPPTPPNQLTREKNCLPALQCQRQPCGGTAAARAENDSVGNSAASPAAASTPGGTAKTLPSGATRSGEASQQRHYWGKPLGRQRHLCTKRSVTPHAPPSGWLLSSGKIFRLSLQ
eukprot:GHVT01031910.1.p1 GENE.GHVT01031910.1~~GHVT01031910.1.p1  ORF type:complete len:256 (-),score=51.94 GHVT01031910.1:652-1419(-)